MLADPLERTHPESAQDRLRQHAALLEAWLTRRARIPTRWRDQSFGKMVDLVRAHLRPVQDHDVLASSYGREHFHLLAVGRQPESTVLLGRNVTEVAYALRWLEITHQVSFGPWLSVITQANGGYLEAR
ncbi:MAG: hypothetical protein ACR2H0_02695 [Candidatus Limnocylindrales bacterium]